MRWSKYSILTAARRRWPHLKIKDAKGRRLLLRCEGCRRWRWAGNARLYLNPRGLCLSCALSILAKEKRIKNDSRVDRLIERLLKNCRVSHRSITPKGYVHLQYQGKLQMLHRLVMGHFLNRPLTKQETVHHRNGRRGDNRLKNLVVYRIHPAGISEQEMVDFLSRLGYTVNR